jgi:BirA family biotin operon repressor/biotin-[acetyl-CoA-carboxylase] ligase
VLLRAGDVPVARWPWLPLVTGVAVADGLRAAAGIEAAVKWPNDVLIDDRKVCGILAERVDDAAVIGMGINTTLTEDELPVTTATSLALAGSQASTTEVVLGVLTELEQAFRRWVEGADLQAWFEQHCATVGRQVRVLQSSEIAVEGLAVGIDEWGRLRVRTPAGERAFAAGDVQHLR